MASELACNPLTPSSGLQAVPDVYRPRAPLVLSDTCEPTRTACLGQVLQDPLGICPDVDP